MPTSSKSQFRFMQGVKSGSIKKPGLTRKTAQEFVDATPDYGDLPEKVPDKKKARPTRKMKEK